MLFSDFQSRLKKVNPDFWINPNHRVTPYHRDFSISGLYHKNDFIMAVPTGFVPEWSMFGVDVKTLLLEGFKGLPEHGSGDFISKDYIDGVKLVKPSALYDRILARGYRVILSSLVARGLASFDRVKKVFGFSPEPNRPDFSWPKRYLALGY